MAEPTDIMERIREEQRQKALAAHLEAGRRQAAQLRELADAAENGALIALVAVAMVNTDQGIGINTLVQDSPDDRMQVIGAVKVLADGLSRAEWNRREQLSAPKRG